MQSLDPEAGLIRQHLTSKRNLLLAAPSISTQGLKKQYIREAQCRVRVISDDDLGLPGLREKYK